VVALAHHHAPPIILQVALQLDPEWTVIPGAVETTVDFARLENESPPLTQADDLFHPLWVSLVGHKEEWATADYADGTDEEGENSRFKIIRVIPESIRG